MAKNLTQKMTKISNRVLHIDDLGSEMNDGVSCETTTWGLQVALREAYRKGWKDAAKAAGKTARDETRNSLLRSLNR